MSQSSVRSALHRTVVRSLTLHVYGQPPVSQPLAVSQRGSFTLGAALAGTWASERLRRSPKRHDFFTGAQAIEIVRPRLHHLAAFGESERPVVHGAHLVPLGVCEL
jgi:hypothetical protein